MNDKVKFIYDLTKDLPHNNKSFFEHLYNVSQIIQQRFPNKEYLIDAGLYHAIYGTYYYNFNYVIDRDVIRTLIGPKAENLVYFYCKLENRIDQILKHQFADDLQKDLYILEYANLLDQFDTCNHNDFLKIKSSLYQYYNLNMDNNSINEQLYIFDGKLSSAQLSHLHGFCLESNYKFGHYSDILSHERDMRFTCHLSKNDFENTGVISSIEKIVRDLNLTVYLREYYINHYSQISYVSKHTDANVDGCVTILIFANKYWEESWGGELKIYEDSNSLVNRVIDFVPGRIVIFDSKIEHKVLPLTPCAKNDRFSLAVKGYLNQEYLIEKDLSNLITIGVAKKDFFN